MILREFNLPDKAIVSKKIHKKHIYENGELNKVEKELIKNDVEKIVWEYSLKPVNINIDEYKSEDLEYLGVEFFSLVLRQEKNYQKIVSLIQKIMQNPLIIVLELDDKFYINASLKRINKKDINKMIVEESIISKEIEIDNLKDNFYKFIESLNIKNLSFKNFYRFYEDIYNKIIYFNLSTFTGNYDESIEIDEAKEFLVQYEKREENLTVLKNRLKSEKQNSKKAEIVKEIKKIMDNNV
ncbi:MAG: DUF4391 domain-containing protein [Candidatus Delongbacteria bacterium]|nr:DUF4391 domain-containing protein [Candidatus Delongbacteria bacterium]MBN2835881.1 DUF4391 domain-containing protein [Candidatus Delongbacteria bacterium]